ncbi:MAG: CDP-alcohol phosphatidyltransferase family protein [Candidatus Verstraetearchaeota archaeon]|nr:CDP-alcohol phosphatidyltransferase family protein [Candidatus Verstraetearchaeota archaeon]
MLNKIRNKIIGIINPIAKIFLKLKLSPNHITIIGFTFSIISAYMFYLNKTLIACIFLILAGLFDIIDGAVARISGKVTKWGGVLDSFLDRYSDMIILSGIILGGLCEVSWGLFSIIGSLMVSYTRLRGEFEGVKLSSIGLMERAERLLLLIIFTLINFIWLGIILLAILTNITAIHRLLYIRRSLK